MPELTFLQAGSTGHAQGGTVEIGTSSNSGAVLPIGSSQGGSAASERSNGNGSGGVPSRSTGPGGSSQGPGGSSQGPGGSSRAVGASGAIAGAGGSSLQAGSAGNISGPAAVLPVASASQLAWQRLETIAFFHFGMNTFTDREWGTGLESASLFQPTALDATQWIRVIKNAGFGLAMLVAKHHDGFCLWPSNFTNHSVKNSSWKNGQGDVLADFTKAALDANIKVGLYLSPCDLHEPSFGTAAYNQYFENQLVEILTNYGPITEIWLDGANCNPNKTQAYDWAGYYAVVRQLQPNAVIAIQGPDVRWVGNESGIAPLGESSVQSVSGTLAWYPSESDVSIRPGWFYHAAEDTQVKPLAQLLDIYYKSVGRNSAFLLNIPPDKRGLIGNADVTRLGELQAALNQSFATNLAQGRGAIADSTYHDAAAHSAAMAVDGDLSTYWAAGEGKGAGRLEIDLGAARTFNLVSLREPIEIGERATKYHVEVEQSGAWLSVASGSVIGQRNLIGLAATTASKVALVIESARGVPAIAEFGLYQAVATDSFASESLLAHKPVTVSSTHPAGTVYGGDKALDDDMATRWATPDGTSAAWLEVDLQGTTTLGRMELFEFAPRITAFQLQYKLNAGDVWQVALAGTKAGTNFASSFPPVSARYVRLNILSASDAPTIWELRVWGN